VYIYICIISVGIKHFLSFLCISWLKFRCMWKHACVLADFCKIASCECTFSFMLHVMFPLTTKLIEVYTGFSSSVRPSVKINWISFIYLRCALVIFIEMRTCTKSYDSYFTFIDMPRGVSVPLGQISHQIE
jgi:hypothetical protein